MAPTYHLAQVNIGLPAEPLTSARLAGFVALLDPVNELADAAPGFVWRLQGDDGNATSIPVLDDHRLIVNMSVWRSVEELAAFVYGGFHAEVMRRRREWFEHLREAYTVAWWIPTGTLPTVADAEQRLLALRANGPRPEAFTLKRPFGPPGAAEATTADPDWFCPA